MTASVRQAETTSKISSFRPATPCPSRRAQQKQQPDTKDARAATTARTTEFEGVDFSHSLTEMSHSSEWSTVVRLSRKIEKFPEPVTNRKLPYGVETIRRAELLTSYTFGKRRINPENQTIRFRLKSPMRRKKCRKSSCRLIAKKQVVGTIFGDVR